LFFYLFFINIFINNETLNYLFSFNRKIRNLLLFLSIFIWIIVIFCYKKTIKKSINFFIWIRILIINILLFFSIKNLILFFFIFELSLIPITVIILGWGYQVERIQASIYLIMYTIFFRLPFFICIITYTNSINNFILLNNNFILLNNFIILLIVLLFIVKFPIYFFHLWLPKAHVEAPVTGSIILAAILLKIGTYGFIRILRIFIYKKFFINLLIMIGFIGCFLSIFICIFQIDQKSLIAYSSVNHITIIFLCLVTYFFISLKASIIIIFIHGLISSSLFNFSNLIYERFNRRHIFFIQSILLTQPLLILFLTISLIINFSVPPFIRVISEILIFITFINWNIFFCFLLLLLIFISCYYSIYLYNLCTHGKISYFSNIIKNSIREYKNIFYYLLFIILLIVNMNFLYFIFYKIKYLI
jgi:NADH-ubiquinone oxidoreductase chain 4